MHIQPTTVAFWDILRKAMIGERILALDAEPTNVMAMVVKWSHYRITIDGSAAVANGIYLQMERDFDGQATFADVKAAVFNDQAAIFNLLEIKEEVTS